MERCAECKLYMYFLAFRKPTEVFLTQLGDSLGYHTRR